ncbi:MAG: SDR family oxidoreductase [Bacteroidota bacterium]
MNLSSQTVAVVTGAASGIGRSLSLQLAQAGVQVAIQDVNQIGLAETQQLIEEGGGVVRSYLIDVGKKEEIYAAKDQILKDFGHVDIVVNNAGVALYRLSLQAVSQEEFDWLMNINFWGVVHGSMAYVPHLLERPESYVINVSSVFGLVGVIHNGPYSCSKFAVRGFTESLRAEHLSTSMHVMVVHPGGIKTNIARNARTRGNDPMREKDVANFEKAFKTTPEKAAETIMKAIARNKSRLLIGSDARVIDLFTRLMPEKFVRTFAEKLIKQSTVD